MFVDAAHFMIPRMDTNKHATAVLAVAVAVGLGLAAYIAASDRPESVPNPVPSTVTIASASDDAVPPPATAAAVAGSAGSDATSAPPTTPTGRCVPGLTIETSARAPNGTVPAGSGREIGRFVLTHAGMPSGCPSVTGNAVVREVTLAVRWGGLPAANARRAAIRNIELRSADRTTLYGRHAGVAAAGGTVREARITLRPTIAIPVGTMRELIIVGDTANAVGGSSNPATIMVSVERVTTEVPSQTRIGTLMY